MGYTALLLDDVRSQLAPTDDALDEARKRRGVVLDAALDFAGTVRGFFSGSLAHRTANCPVHQRDKGLDADCGMVLDRRTYWQLGPDGAGVGPDEIVREVVHHITDKVRVEYPGATFTVTKRAILVHCHRPLPSGEDPTVDLIVALDRRSQEGLWIPNTVAHRWDPSHPERHTEMLTAPPAVLRLVRARAVRLAKAENKRTDLVPLCSFNLEALALMFVNPTHDVAHGLLALWERGASDLRERLTPDPANVSPPIKVEDRAYAVGRLEFAADRLRSALRYDDDPATVRSELRQLWPEFIAERADQLSKARTIEALKLNRPVSVTTTGGLAAAAASTVVLKSPRSFGNPNR